MTTNPNDFTKILRPGRISLSDDRTCNLFIKIEFKNDRLSLTGVEGPTINGNAHGSCGQIIMHPWSITEYAPGWDTSKVERLRSIWDKWHLNDMRPGCIHQQDWPTTEKVELVSYKLTTAAYQQRDAAIAEAARSALAGEPLNLTPTSRALATLTNWFQPIYSPPDADSPLSGCYEVDKRETKNLGWLTQQEHPLGCLSKPCPVCGHAYGSAWLFEPVPPSDLDFLRSLPPTDTKPCWV